MEVNAKWLPQWRPSPGGSAVSGDDPLPAGSIVRTQIKLWYLAVYSVISPLE